MRPLLSVCIPTYNRKKELAELIDILLSVNREDFEIVVTDNQSTDGTDRMVRSYEDRRLRYLCNLEPIPALQNVIRSIYNGKGKYVLYCNDRDLLYASRIEKLMETLAGIEVSFLYSPRYSNSNSMSLNLYQQSYESLMNQSYIHHPSGMVFHRELIERYTNEADYASFIPVVYTYDFLMLDLLQYEQSAIFDCGYWSPRPMSYLREHRAGTGPNLYFLPETREQVFYKVFEHIFHTNDYQLTSEQKKNVMRHLYECFAVLFCTYKLSMSDHDETAHYNLQVSNISTAEMLRICNSFFGRSVSFAAENGFSDELVRYAKKQKSLFLSHAFVSCMKINLLNIYKNGRRMISRE